MHPQLCPPANQFYVTEVAFNTLVKRRSLYCDQLPDHAGQVLLHDRMNHFNLNILYVAFSLC